MKLISKKEAKQKGLTRFFTGKPCHKGHIAERHTSGKCVACEKLRGRVANMSPAQIRNKNNYHRMRTLGVTPELFDYLWKKQNGKCAVCGGELVPGQSTHTDHCHTTGSLRGLLCRDCNLAEGHIKNLNIAPEEWGKRLAEYLKNPPAKEILDLI